MIDLCSDCPPIGYPTEKTRCRTCPRREDNEGAILVSTDGDAANGVWLAKSLVEFEKKDKGIVLVTAPEWLLIQRGLV